jgi:probable HAF family extracellular repeat protein
MITDLGTLPGGTLTQAYALNNLGQVVGVGDTTGSTGDHGFLWQNGAMIDLGIPASHSSCDPKAINDLGQIVGSTNPTGTATSGAFVWSAANGLVTLPTDGGGVGISNQGLILTSANSGPGSHSDVFQFSAGQITLLSQLAGASAGINSLGQVAATSITPDTTSAALWNSATGQITLLGFTPGQGSMSTGINESGQVIANASVGQTATGFPIYHPFLWDPVSGLQDLGTSPSFFGLASGINAHGDVVGTYTQSSTSGSFVYTGGTLYDLQSLVDPVSGTGWSNLVAYQINDLGQIVGFGTHNGATRAFLLTPIKEVAAPTVQIRSATMVDAHDLSLAVTVQYPQAQAGRWIHFTVDINGTSINPTTAAAACTVRLGASAKATVSRSVTINLADFDGKGTYVRRFTSNIEAAITCQAGAPNETTGSATAKLAILLPVVLIPGISPVPAIATGGDGTFPNMERFLKSKSKAVLQSRGLLGSPYALRSDPSIHYPTIYTLSYFQNQDSFKTGAKDLVQLINTIGAKTYADAVNLVGHSKGSLVGRQFVVSNPQVIVPNLIMCAPPNAGSAWASFYSEYTDLTPTWPWFRIEQPLPYTPSDNPELTALNQIPLPATTNYTILYSSSHPTLAFETGLRAQLSPGDEIVPAFSALGKLPDPNHPGAAPSVIPAFANASIEEEEIDGKHTTYVNGNTAVQTVVFGVLTRDLN